ncbi:hypothetical protein AB0K09_07995 [Streptomyces sp. NPDC049577]|uniref:hypothetical protein n=1 Tax=Streptomyces sp. NPDC049577 TaxID=3155153 RepID=UPI00343E684A
MALFGGMVPGGQEGADALISAVPPAEGGGDVGVVAGAALGAAQAPERYRLRGGERGRGVAAGVLRGDEVELDGGGG